MHSRTPHRRLGRHKQIHNSEGGSAFPDRNTIRPSSLRWNRMCGLFQQVVIEFYPLLSLRWIHLRNAGKRGGVNSHGLTAAQEQPARKSFSRVQVVSERRWTESIFTRLYGGVGGYLYRNKRGTGRNRFPDPTLSPVSFGCRGKGQRELFTSVSCDRPGPIRPTQAAPASRARGWPDSRRRTSCDAYTA